MTPCIVTPAEAQEMLGTAAPWPWHLDGDVRDADGRRVALVATGHPRAAGNFALLVSAPNLSATVASEPSRIAAAVAAERAAIVAQIRAEATALAGRNATCAVIADHLVALARTLASEVTP